MPFRLPVPDNAIIGMNVPFHRFPAAKTKIMTMDEVEVEWAEGGVVGLVTVSSPRMGIHGLCQQSLLNTQHAALAGNDTSAHFL